jgi:hypothetical protein
VTWQLTAVLAADGEGEEAGHEEEVAEAFAALFSCYDGTPSSLFLLNLARRRLPGAGRRGRAGAGRWGQVGADGGQAAHARPAGRPHRRPQAAAHQAAQRFCSET